MGNCLVKNFKGSIDNDEMVAYGEFPVGIKGGASPYRIGLNCATSFGVRVTGNATITYDGVTAKSHTLPGATTCYLDINSADDCILFIEEKYKVLVFTSFNVANSPNKIVLNLDDLKFTQPASGGIDIFIGTTTSENFQGFISGSLDSLSHLNIRNLILSQAKDIDKFLQNSAYKSSLVQLRCTPNGDGFELGDLSQFTALTTLGLNKISGDFSVLASAPALTRAMIASSPQLTGSVEDYVAIKKLSGAGSLSLYFPKANTPDITWQGQKISTYPNDVIPMTDQVYLNWDAEGNITWS